MTSNLNQSQTTNQNNLSDYSIINTLGSGAHGTVVLVQHNLSKNFFAMKIQQKPKKGDHKQIVRMKSEWQILSSLQHKFIPKLESSFETKKSFYLVMEYCSGGDLFDMLNSYGKIDAPLVKIFASELVICLEFLHKNGVLYRDLKPENILFSDDGHIKLCDFGLAKIGHFTSTMGGSSICGSPEYMAPEILNNRTYGFAVDWWGFGLVLYEMLTAIPAVKTSTRFEMENESVTYLDLNYPDYVSTEAQLLITGLVTIDPNQRLGSRSVEDIKSHSFFHGIDWTSTESSCIQQNTILESMNSCITTTSTITNESI